MPVAVSLLGSSIRHSCGYRSAGFTSSPPRSGSAKPSTSHSGSGSISGVYSFTSKASLSVPCSGTARSYASRSARVHGWRSSGVRIQASGERTVPIAYCGSSSRPASCAHFASELPSVPDAPVRMSFSFARVIATYSTRSSSEIISRRCLTATATRSTVSYCTPRCTSRHLLPKPSS